MLGICTMFLLDLSAATKATDNLTADALAEVINDKAASTEVRLKALEELFSRHFKPQGTLEETASFFKRCRWIKKEDWEIVYAFTGVWPFKEEGIFAASGHRTLPVAVDMKPQGFDAPTRVWLGFPNGHNISEPEVELILSGKCPARLANIHLLDGTIESYLKK